MCISPARTGGRSPAPWGEPEFRSEAPQISLRKCVDRAPKFRASFAQISWETQAIHCVNIQYLHTPLPIYPTLILPYSTLCALSPPCACYSAASARSAGNLRASAQLDEPRGRFRREQRRCRETKRSSLPRPRRRNAPRLPFCILDNFRVTLSWIRNLPVGQNEIRNFRQLHLRPGSTQISRALRATCLSPNFGKHCAKLSLRATRVIIHHPRAALRAPTWPRSRGALAP